MINITHKCEIKNLINSDDAFKIYDYESEFKQVFINNAIEVIEEYSQDN